MTTPSDFPVRVAVVGSGPAGVYACESLLAWADQHERDIVVDCLDRLPVPYGLLRHGVAPDHPRIKGIARTLESIVTDPRIRFLGNVEFGRDLTLEDVPRLYHAVIFATGALADRELGIPGEHLEGSYGAAQFVTWYDGHPDARRNWALTADRAAVVGVGNVALDVARMLVRTPEQLEATDIPAHVREGFGTSATRVVSVIGRRGPAYAKFTPLELREMGKVEGLTIVVDTADLEYDDEARDHLEHDRRAGQVCDQLAKWAAAQAETGHPSADAAEAAALSAGGRVVRFRFHRSPVEVLGTDGRVTGLRLERTEPDGTRVRATGVCEDIAVDAVYKAVGYRSDPLDGVPFDPATSTIPNDGGRVLTGPGGEPVQGLFTAGWVKRGPTGVIGTNRHCAVDTVNLLVADLEAGALFAPTATDPQAVRDLLAERGVTVVDGPGWAAIDTSERSLGEASGRERTKLGSREEMLAAALESQPNRR
ncbi:FAD-dependent oxidoreductase [Rhodococcus sp. IEGM 1408]|uniref:FAD-dependent oxidoreductase n=1 Tax=Rhodococcus sp. IEGM 1408 TaxID=3082220 RepID=UPI002953F2A0|nr:FAD-dependent oxidoreductase [Rhodococcus sp. IEGM 1408]MDV8001650.1 FAD-dependent oxidoreductase [Rhodococcus sp. IEGM 1408]